MSEKVNVSIPVAPEAAEALRDPQMMLKASALISVLIRPADGSGPLRQAMDDLAAEAEANGLTAEDVEAELAAHKRERAR